MRSWQRGEPYAGARRDAGSHARARRITALQAYAALTTSAARGAVRDVTQVARSRTAQEGTRVPAGVRR